MKHLRIPAATILFIGLLTCCCYPQATNNVMPMVIYNFTGGADGGTPKAGLIQATDGNFYGTTSAGGASNTGTYYNTLSAWQGCVANGCPSAHDSHSITANPALNGSYAPTVALTGVNLTSLGITALNSDYNGSARPSTGAWTIGAINQAGSASYVGSSPSPGFYASKGVAIQ